MPLELEEKWAGVRFKLRLSIRCQHEFIEELRIKKARIRLSGLHAIAGLPSSAGNPVQAPNTVSITLGAF